MTHGTTGTITMAVDQFAEVIFSAGFDVLLYDHKSFGRSGGESSGLKVAHFFCQLV